MKNDHDLVWGAEAIAKEINRSRRQTYGLLESNQLPARKCGQTWVASREKLRERLTGEKAGE